jgi:hypothetical protein
LSFLDVFPVYAEGVGEVEGVKNEGFIEMVVTVWSTTVVELESRTTAP